MDLYACAITTVLTGPYFLFGFQRSLQRKRFKYGSQALSPAKLWSTNSTAIPELVYPVRNFFTGAKPKIFCYLNAL